MSSSEKDLPQSETTFIPVRWRLALVVHKVLTVASRLLPPQVVCATGNFLGRCAAPFFRKERQISKAQLDVAFGKDCWDPKLLTEIFASVGEGIAETFFIPKFLAVKNPNAPHRGDNFHTIQNSASLDPVVAAYDAGRGVIALTGHVSNFELLAAYYVANGFQLSIVARDPNYPVIRTLSEQLRAGYGGETMWREDAGSSMRLLRSLKEGAAIGVLIDQDIAIDNAFAPFFGIPAAHPATIIRVGIKQRIPICSTFIARTSRGRHKVIAHSIPYDPDSPTALEDVLRQYSKNLEQTIRQYPSQWIWWHRRWRRRPEVDYKAHPEQLRPTAEYIRWLEHLASNPQERELLATPSEPMADSACR